MRLRLRAGAAAALLASMAACDSTTAPEVQRQVPVLLDFCSNDIPVWFVYQNEGGPWTVVPPDAAGTFSFIANNRVTVAYVREGDFGDEIATDVIFTTNTELEHVSGTSCLEENGTKSVRGSVSGVSGQQLALVGMNFSSVYVSPAQPGFTLSGLPDRPVDVLASRVLVSGAVQSADRVIIRRTRNFVNDAVMPVLDFNGAEPVVPVVSSAIVSGILSDESAFLVNNFFSQLETSHTLSYLDSPLANGVHPFVSLPASVLAAGEYHDLFVSALNGDGAVRGVERFFRAPADQALALGPRLAEPSITAVASTPYVRLSTQFASQLDYDDYVTVEFEQEDAFFTLRRVALRATAGHFRGAPAAWELVIPDLSGAPGWQDFWGLQAGSNIDWIVSGFGGRSDLLLGARPADGEEVRYAVRTSFIAEALLGTSGRVSRTLSSAVPPRRLFSPRP